jgi:hypothetical protein
VSQENEKLKSKRERIARLRERLGRVWTPLDAVAVLKGILDLLEDEL